MRPTGQPGMLVTAELAKNTSTRANMGSARANASSKRVKIRCWVTTVPPHSVWRRTFLKVVTHSQPRTKRSSQWSLSFNRRNGRLVSSFNEIFSFLVKRIEANGLGCLEIQVKERSIPLVITQEMSALNVFFSLQFLPKDSCVVAGRGGSGRLCVTRNLWFASHLAAARNELVHREMRQMWGDAAQTSAGEKNSLSNCECGSRAPSGC